MELKEFVAESLKQIVEGVVEAQAHCAREGAKIVPFVRASENGPEAFVGGAIHKVNFDVAITTENKDGKNGETKLCIFGLDVGGGLSAEQVNATISRVKFDIPVLLPRSDLA